jgi:hypothetical protein
MNAPQQHPIESALVLFEDGGHAATVDVLIWNGQPWLVPKWNDQQGRPATKPARLIPLARFRHQHTPLNPKFPHQRTTWTVNDPLPNALFGETVPPQLAAQYGVIENPPIEIALPTDAN